MYYYVYVYIYHLVQQKVAKHCHMRTYLGCFLSDDLCPDRSCFQKSGRRCHLRPCDTGGNSSEASTASSPHVALAGMEERGDGEASVPTEKE